MKYFVVVFDTANAERMSLEAFDDPEAALTSRFKHELMHAAESDIEVALLRAASEKAIRDTHPRYFAQGEKTKSTLAPV